MTMAGEFGRKVIDIWGQLRGQIAWTDLFVERSLDLRFRCIWHLPLSMRVLFTIRGGDDCYWILVVVHLQ